MANDRITMIKLKRMLQLLDAGKSMNEICRELSMSKRTVHSYKQRVLATTAWPPTTWRTTSSRFGWLIVRIRLGGYCKKCNKQVLKVVSYHFIKVFF